MGKRVECDLLVSFMIAFLLAPAISYARIYLFDKKIEINGSIEQKANWKFNLKDWEKGKGPHNSRENLVTGEVQKRYAVKWRAGTPRMPPPCSRPTFTWKDSTTFIMRVEQFWTVSLCLNGSMTGLLR